MLQEDELTADNRYHPQNLCGQQDIFADRQWGPV